MCNVVIVVSTGTNLDMDLMHCLQRAEMLKFQLPDFPLIPPGNFGQTHHDMNYYPDIGKKKTMKKKALTDMRIFYFF